MSFEILGVDLYHILSWFILYSFLGWVWESSYVSIKTRKPVNRGFVSGPFVTIYGVGAVSVYVILRPLAGHALELYFAGVVVATALEYITGVLMEALFHTNWWDYSDKKFNFQGKICLTSSVAWGIFTLVLFYILQPAVSYLVEHISRRTGIVLVYVWLLYYISDFAMSAAAAFDLRGKLQRLDGVWEDFQEYLQGSRLYEAVGEAREKAEAYRLEVSAGKVSEYLDARKEQFLDALERVSSSGEDIKDTKERFLEKYNEFSGKYLEVKKSFRHISKRHMRAYPNLISKAERLRRKNEKKQRNNEKKK